MERHELLEMMAQLKLAGMRTAYDEILANGLKRRHPVQEIIGTLLKAEIADKKARSIKYQMGSARLPTVKELADFDFAASPVNEPLIRELATGGFLEGQRNIVLVGGTGTGKTHLAVAIARSCIRKGARGRCHNVVDLVNDLEAELRVGRQSMTMWMSRSSGTLASTWSRNLRNSRLRWRRKHLPMTSPVATSRAANSEVVPLRL